MDPAYQYNALLNRAPVVLGQVRFRFAHATSFFSHKIVLRVEDLVEKSSFKSQVNLGDLRHSLQELRDASQRLDEEKVRAHFRLRRALWELRHRSTIRHKLHKVYCKIRRWFGKKCHGDRSHEHRHGWKHDTAPRVLLEPVRGDKHVKLKPRIGRLPGWIKEQREQAGEDQRWRHHSGHKSGHGHCRGGLKEVIRAAKHVRDVNRRLYKFEQGFISEDGIKDREWYRHLGVAPGKWLGACWFNICSLRLH